jgi:hypothetical protein
VHLLRLQQLPRRYRGLRPRLGRVTLRRLGRKGLRDQRLFLRGLAFIRESP